jgi:FAD/FMN-containing dehydrogenase
MIPVETAYIDVEYRKARNLDHAFELFQQGDKDFRYSVAWIDCLAHGDALGRCVLMRGNHATAGQIPARLRRLPLQIKRKRLKSVPFNFPSFVLNSWSVRAFNELYYRRHGDARKIVDYNSFFYPLDGITHWNRMYGRRGFVQYQALFPPESSASGMRALIELIAASRMASFLAVLKSTGAANDGLLSFPKPGHTLALDLPNQGGRLLDLLTRLDALVLQHGGRLYLAKDATMSAETFAQMYPRLREFQALRKRIDPDGRWSSAQAARLHIVEPA